MKLAERILSKNEAVKDSSATKHTKAVSSAMDELFRAITIFATMRRELTADQLKQKDVQKAIKGLTQFSDNIKEDIKSLKVVTNANLK